MARWTDPAAGEAAIRVITAMLGSGDAYDDLTTSTIRDAVETADAVEIVRVLAGMTTWAIGSAAAAEGGEPAELLQRFALGLQQDD